MTGSLQQKNGKYYAVINVKDKNGHRKPKWVRTGLKVKGNKKKAEKFLRDTIKEYEAKEGLISTDTLFSDFVLHWLKLKKPSVDEVTYQGYETLANAHIVPYFKAKKIKLCDINRNDIQLYIDEKSINGRRDGKGGLSAKSVKSHIVVIKQVLKEAVKSGFIASNPSDFVTLPKVQRYDANFYNVEQISQMLTALKDEPLYPLIYFTVIYGLRRSEVLGLKYDSVDFFNNTLTIKHTVVRFSELVEKDSTKNTSSYRSYPLTKEVKEILISLKEKDTENRRLFGKEYTANDYIFKWDNGTVYSPNYVTQKFKSLLEKYNLPHIRFHDLRHSCASLLIANGFQLKDISEWLGHADIQTTANIYGHLDTERKNKIAQSMSNSFNI